jgi:NADH-quinone oxidoreductase subunit D
VAGLIDDPRFVLPEKEKSGSIEGLMHHFKIIGGSMPPAKLICRGRGQRRAGFYIVSQGGGRPYRIRVRPPCFIAMGAFEEMIKGYMVADIVPTFGMINMIGGECDR